MKQMLFGPSSWRWRSENYIAPFNKLERAPMGTEASVFTPGIGKTSTSMILSGTVLEALQRIWLAGRRSITGGILVTAHNDCVVRFPLVGSDKLIEAFNSATNIEGDDIQVMYNPESGKFKACITRQEDGHQDIPAFLGNEVYFFMAVLVYAIRNDCSEEAGKAYEGFLNSLKSFPVMSEADEAACVKEAFILSNNLYARVTYEDACESRYKGSGIRINLEKIELLTEAEIDSLALRPVIGMDADKEDGVTRELGSVNGINSSIKGLYAISDRDLTGDEEMLVPVIPDTYQITETNHWIGKLILDSTKLPSPVRNFLFIGPGGSGKTEAVKIQAAMANKPLVHYSGDPDADKIDLAQTVIPDGSGGFVYTESPLMEALEKGWWCEFSEADLLLKQGALGYLNPLLDKTGVLQLSTGRLVKRHPEAVLFFTINGNYEGCRPMNRAVKDRLMPVRFTLPDDDTLVERVMSESGYDNKREVRKMVKVLHKVQDYCNTNCLDDGVIGVRSLIRWATAVACGGNAWMVAKQSIINSWTFDVTEFSAIMRCVETQFPPKEVEL